MNLEFYKENPRGRPQGWRKFYNQIDKRCSKCKEIKLLEHFPNDSSRNDGKSAYCVPCKYDYNKTLRSEKCLETTTTL